MSAAWALALAFGPTALGFALLSFGNPKRRRTAGEAAAPRYARPLGYLLIVGTGLLVLTTAGAVAFLIWTCALGAMGWALANFVVVASSLSRWWDRARLRRVFGDGAIGNVVGTSTSKGPRPRLTIALRRMNALGASPMSLLTILSATSAMLSLIAVCVSLWSTERMSDATRTLLAIQTVGTLTQDRSTVAASPCLAAFDGRADTTQALRDLLSGRAFNMSSLIDRTADVVGNNLQYCIFAVGGDEIAVEKKQGESSKIYSVDQKNAKAILQLIISRLHQTELLADVYATDAALCGLVRPHIDDNVAAFVTLLRQAKSYPKAQMILDALPSLNRLLEEQPVGSRCM